LVLNNRVTNHEHSSADVEASVKEWFNKPNALEPRVGSQASVAGDSLSLTLGGLLQMAKDNRWGIIIMTVLGCVAGVFKAISETPVYQASLTMAVEPSNSRNSGQALFDPYAYRFYETQYFSAHLVSSTECTRLACAGI